MLKRMAEQDRQLVAISGFETRELVLHDGEQRRVGGLVLPAFRRQRDAAGGRDQQKPRILVAGVEQRIMAAIDERVVYRADGQQPGAVEVVAKTGGAKEQKQILLGDAKLDMLALRVGAPALRAGEPAIAKDVIARVLVEHAAPVDPRAEICRYGYIRAHRHDMLGKCCGFTLGAADFREDFAKAGLRAHAPPGDARLRQGRGDGDGRGWQPAAVRRERRGVGYALHEALDRAGGGQALEAVPFMTGADVHLRPEACPSARSSSCRHGCLYARQRAAPCL